MSPSHKPVPHHECLAVREVLNRVGDKWSVLVVALLQDGPRRFSEIRRSIEGVSQRMLTLTSGGGADRPPAPRPGPPRVDYKLTNLGRTLLKPIVALAEWAQGHGGDIQGARQRYDARQPPVGTGPKLKGAESRPVTTNRRDDGIRSRIG